MLKRLASHEVYLIFDRYKDFSTKGTKRKARATSSCVLQLTLNTHLPASKNAILTVSNNKQQLNAIICKELLNDKAFLSYATATHKLIVTGQEHIPVQVYKGRKFPRLDLESPHEEADIVLVQQLLSVANDPDLTLIAECDDTDIFVQLVYFYFDLELKCEVIMESPVNDRLSTDVGATATLHSDIAHNLLATHALTGCDTVAATFGIGKATAINVAKRGFSLLSLGKLHSTTDQIGQQAVAFMSACYGSHLSKCTSMTDCRQRQWAHITGKLNASAPKLCTLPPTTEAFMENVKRAHHQVAQWMSTPSGDPPPMDARSYGWEEDTENKM